MLASLRTSGKAASPRRASNGKAASNVLATAALQRMEHDPDISAERDGTRAVAAGGAAPKRVPLNVVNQSHRANAATAALAAEVGLPKLLAFTTKFYEKARAGARFRGRETRDRRPSRTRSWTRSSATTATPTASASRTGSSRRWAAARSGPRSGRRGPCARSRAAATSSRRPTTGPPPTSPRGIRRSATRASGATTSSSTTAECGCASTSGPRGKRASSTTTRPSPRAPASDLLQRRGTPWYL